MSATHCHSVANEATFTYERVTIGASTVSSCSIPVEKVIRLGLLFETVPRRTFGAGNFSST